MSFSNPPPEAENRLLLELFKRRVRELLEKEILAAIRPAMGKAIDGAVGSLEADMQRHYDAQTNRTIHQLIVTRHDK
ncbi:hypothetical protein [Dyella silvatica]|uniref:hypothetical protein n=1 Tax=Dyella silvatica TaxID=2992128 RepID=UPI00224E79AC|nr:hypothetical protein [Dyella silvatica]